MPEYPSHQEHFSALRHFGERKRKQPVRRLRIQMLEKDVHHQDPRLCAFPAQQFRRQAFGLSFGLCGILPEVTISACRWIDKSFQWLLWEPIPLQPPRDFFCSIFLTRSQVRIVPYWNWSMTLMWGDLETEETKLDAFPKSPRIADELILTARTMLITRVACVAWFLSQ